MGCSLEQIRYRLIVGMEVLMVEWEMVRDLLIVENLQEIQGRSLEINLKPAQWGCT